VCVFERDCVCVTERERERTERESICVHACVCMCVCVCIRHETCAVIENNYPWLYLPSNAYIYGVASTSKLLKIMGRPKQKISVKETIFCRRDL